MSGNQWRRRWATVNGNSPGGPSVRPGRNGAGWNLCRRIVIANANGRCAICGGPLDPTAKGGDDRSTEVDHHPEPLWRLEELYGAGTQAFERAANDPNRCRAVHRRCHKLGRPAFDTRTVAQPTTPRRTRPVHDTMISIG